MKQYPSIQGPSKAEHGPCHVFVKYDGSNIRFEWSRKAGWYKYGSRHELIDSSHPILGESIQIFHQKYAGEFAEIFKTKQYREAPSVVVFCEFAGVKSFAGTHQPDDPKELIPFDVSVYKRGIIGPQEFLDNFGKLDIATWLGKHNFGPQLISSIREERFESTGWRSHWNNEIPEGVVCKRGEGHKLWMAKIKTNRYLQALKATKPDWQQYWE